jgi:CBS domain-containing protein
MQIKDVMHKGATCVESSTPVKEIAKRMRDDDVGAIPVRANGQLIGIVTDRDITCRAVAGSADLGKLTAQDVMSKNVTCCSPEQDVAVALKTMERKKVRRLPVADKDSGLVGMLSLGDISHKVSEDLSGELLRAVSAHHR